MHEATLAFYFYLNNTVRCANTDKLNVVTKNFFKYLLAISQCSKLMANEEYTKSLNKDQFKVERIMLYSGKRLMIDQIIYIMLPAAVALLTHHKKSSR